MNIDDFHPIALSVGKASHNADWNWQNVCSPFSRIYYICSGEAEVRFQSGQCIKLCPGKLYFIPAFTTHTNICTGHFVHYYVHVYEDGKIEEQGEFDSHELPIEVPALEHDDLLFARLVELNPMLKLAESDPDTYDDNHTLLHTITINKNRPVGLKLESRGILYMLLSRFIYNAVPKQSLSDPRIAESIKYIRSHLSSQISVEELASMSCLTIDYYIRLFRQTMHCTPLQYINTKRIEKAQLLLFSQNTSVKNIAFSLGYDDVSYFIRVFKRITGMTPNAYKQSMSLSGAAV